MVAGADRGLARRHRHFMKHSLPVTSPMTAIASTPERTASALAIALALAAVYVLWGSTYLAIRFALESYPPFLLGAIRMAIAGALMFAVLRWRGVNPSDWKQGGTLAVQMVVMVLLSNGLVNI